ncbi:hypothetical protein [Gorillibacterium sp. CAU 1737]|uniref:hypothetical protein n=1 Tax=Gorillibacterium sp. CAU 1737 TaxID=3140362 RepID=UPI003260B520
MKKHTWVVLAVSCSLIFGGVALANGVVDKAKPGETSVVVPCEVAIDEQLVKVKQTEAADLEAARNPQSDRERFLQAFAGYKDLYAIESAAYADQSDSTDPAVQRVWKELERKGDVIARFEQLLTSQSEKEPSLYEAFVEETQQVNQELYPEQYK